MDSKFSFTWSEPRQNLISVIEKVFDDQECGMAISAASIPDNSTLFKPSTHNDQNSEVIKCLTSTFFPNQQSIAFYMNRLSETVFKANQNTAKFDLTGVEKIEVMKFLGSDGFYARHVDYQPSWHATRKLTCLLELSNPNDYEGGDIAFYNGPQDVITPKAAGTLIVFPSYVPYEIKTVTKGTKILLAAYFVGPPFK